MLSITVAKSYELTAAQAQALMDLEVTVADLGLMLWIACARCHLIADPVQCAGGHTIHDDGTITLTLTCKCTERAFRGNLIPPNNPKPLRKPRIDQFVKPEELLSREHMRVFQDADTALRQLKLRYLMRCRACQMENRSRDGVWGAHESTAEQYVIECDCTKRIYKGSDVKLA